MNHIFIELLNNALITSALIMAVILVRLCIKKAPRWISCALWGLVAVKLIIPFHIESILSLVPNSEPIPINIEYQAVPQITSSVPTVNQVINPVLADNFAANVAYSVNPMQIVISVASMIWIGGVALLCLYALVSYILLRKRVAVSQKICERVYSCDEVQSPFILGVINPKIYMPSGMDEDVTDCVLEHERAHLKRGDHIWKPLGFLILAVYWFQPLCWIAYILLCKDIELACDEKVAKNKDREWKAEYCQALLECHVKQKMITACPVAFGEVSVKDRVKNVLNYKKPALFITVAALALGVVVAICFMTDQKGNKDLSVSGQDMEAAGDENTTDSQTNGGTQTQDKELENALNATANKWAKAICAGDGKTIIAMADQEVIKNFEDADLLRQGEGTVYFSLGSSPMLEWPDGITPYVVSNVDVKNQTVSILYYAWTSDPHVVVLKEQLNLSGDGDTYTIDAENMTYLDDIASAEEILTAYPLGIKDTLMNYYEKNSFGETLNQNALLSSGNVYHDLFAPQTAVYDLLNIGNKGNMRTEVESGSNPDTCDVRISFPDGVITVTMIRPYGETGIWLPYDYHMEDPSENVLTLQELVQLVTTDSFADIQKQKGISLWDSYTNLTEDEAYDAEALTNLKRAEFTYDGTVFELRIYYWAEDTSVDEEYKKGEVYSVRLVNAATQDSFLLYIADDRYVADVDIESFLAKKYELPSVLLDNNENEKLKGKLSYSDYRVDLFLNFAGCLFKSESYKEPTHGDWTPEAWYSLGGAGVCTDSSYGSYEKFSDGQLIEYQYTDNHMSSELVTTFQNDAYSGCLYRYNIDLVTASETDLLGEGDLPEAQYWVVFFTEGEGQPLYMKFFDSNYYSKGDALKSVSIIAN